MDDNDLRNFNAARQDAGRTSGFDNTANVDSPASVDNATRTATAAGAAAGVATGAAAATGKAKNGLAKILGASVLSGILFAALGFGTAWYLRDGEVSDLENKVQQLETTTTNSSADNNQLNASDQTSSPAPSTEEDDTEEIVLQVIDVSLKAPKEWGLPNQVDEDGWLVQSDVGVTTPDGVKSTIIGFANRTDVTVGTSDFRFFGAPRGGSFVDAQVINKNISDNSTVLVDEAGVFIYEVKSNGLQEVEIVGYKYINQNGEYPVFSARFLPDLNEQFPDDKDLVVQQIKELLESVTKE